MKSLTISLGLFLSTLCILDVSHGQKLDDALHGQKLDDALQEAKPLDESTIKVVREDILNKSNEYRKEHKLNPIDINPELQSNAQIWANILAENKDWNGIAKPDYNGYVYEIAPCQHVGEVLVDWWYMGLPYTVKANTEWEKLMNSYARSAYHLLWKNTEHIGIGVAKDIKKNFYHIVVLYTPETNFVGKYADNEPKLDRKTAEEIYIKECYFIKGLNKKELNDPSFSGKIMEGWKSSLYPNDTKDVVFNKSIIDENRDAYREIFDHFDVPKK